MCSANTGTPTTDRWVLLDTQFDETWRAQLKIDHDAFDVPRDRFLTASDAWTLCRSGKADPDLFGIFQGNKRGLWFVAAELIRDVAALNKMEVLVWDVWGAMPKPDTQLDAKQLEIFRPAGGADARSGRVIRRLDGAVSL